MNRDSISTAGIINHTILYLQAKAIFLLPLGACFVMFAAKEDRIVFAIRK